MCIPLAVGAALSVGGSLLNAYGANQQGEAVSDAETYNRAVTENSIRQLNTQAAEQRSALALDARNQLDSGQTSFAAGNVGLGTGTAGAWEIDVGKALESDYASVETGLNRRIAGLREEQELSRRRGASARRAGTIGAATSLLSGFGSVAKGFA